MKRHYWTEEEKQLLRLHYGPLAKQPWLTSKIATVVGLSEDKVRTMAYRMGLCWQSRVFLTKDNPKLFQLYAAGLSDGKIAFRMDCSRHQVITWRKLNSLPANYANGNKRKLEAV